MILSNCKLTFFASHKGDKVDVALKKLTYEMIKYLVKNKFSEMLKNK